MRTLFFSASLITAAFFSTGASASQGDAPAPALDSDVDCDHLLIDRNGRSVYFNRWALPSNINQESLLNRILGQLPPERPAIILDTNPSPTAFADYNLIRPGVDKAYPSEGSNSTYANLDSVSKDVLFRSFVNRSDDQLNGSARAVLIFDHHFNSRLLSTASATPLTVDFLKWLQQQPPSAEIENVRKALRTGVVLRDHSDPDIVLANLALTWLDRPAVLERYGSRIRDIALFNDHGLLNDELDERGQLEVLLGYNIVVAFEKWIPAKGPGAFDRALAMIPPLLNLADEVANVPGVVDMTATFLRVAEDDARTQSAPVREILARMRNAWNEDQSFHSQVDRLLTDRQSFRREGRALVLTFPPTVGEAPSGLNAMRALKEKHSAQIAGAKVLVVVAPVIRGERTLTHVKIRSLDAGFRIDSVIEGTRARGLGGGGRSGAGGLYPSAGGDVTEEQRAEHLQWLLNLLNR